ncbi:MAG: sterol desaturase family protein [Chitinophagaceae bacterium]|jgi:sterol desaturase/sphingolipid hydroxylase (fatty acid hydroxylase superfamily)
MKLNIIAFAVPLFLAFMGLEYYYSKKRGKEVYHFQDFIANISVGIGERLADLFTTGIFYLIFQYIYENWRLFTIETGWWQWITLFVFTDFIWYWYHRLGHEVNILWAAHVVHHQSEDFNYSVSARITVFQSMARGVFWCLLPLLGFAPSATFVMLLIHGAYPFFTHTQLIGQLGFLEYFLVTPSHHRVHHSSNPEYLDNNYGDVLIIWDKLFGTFATENTKPVYGLTSPLKSYSFLWQHFHFPLELFISFKRATSFKAKCKVLFGKPDDLDPSIRAYLEKLLLLKRPVKNLTPRLKNYVSIQTIILLITLFCTLLFENYLHQSVLFLLSGLILLTVILNGAILEQKKWIFDLEFVRFAIILIYTFRVVNYDIQAILLVFLLSVNFIYLPLKAKYDNFLLNDSQ